MGRVRTAKEIAWSRCGWLSTATALLWLVLVGPAWYVAGRDGLLGLTVATFLCLVPGLIVFWLAAGFGSAGSQVPLVVLGGSALRMLFVLLGMVVVQTANPHLGFREFVIWLLVLYLSLLAVETSLVLRRSDDGESRVGGIGSTKAL